MLSKLIILDNEIDINLNLSITLKQLEQFKLYTSLKVFISEQSLQI